MKKYILIQNDGEIEVGGFELIGASTKRNQEGKIGFFGSGLKYSIAYMMRNGINFKIFSGENEIVFTHKEEIFREQNFNRIYINGNPTSYTTTMGATWTEDWFVLREIYCNALDETNCLIIPNTENINPQQGKTRIYIELTDSLKNVSSNWDSYFSSDRIPLFNVNDIYTSYLGHDDGVNGRNRQSVQVYNKTEGIMYRKGIRVYKNKRYLYDYNFDFVTINEDRTAKNPSGIQYCVYNLFAQFCDRNYILSILRNGTNVDEPCGEFDYINNSDNTIFSEKWIEFSKDYLLVVKEKSGKYLEEIQKSKKEYLLMPNLFAQKLKSNIPEVRILGMDKVINGASFTECDFTPKMEYLLNDVLRSLKEMKYECNYEIFPVNFDDPNILGHADIYLKKIYISSNTFDLGKRELALTIMEETEHIKSGKEDESREFQNHIFSQWLKSMEENNGLFF